MAIQLLLFGTSWNAFCCCSVLELFFFNTFDLWLVGTWICRGSTVYNYTAHLNYRRQKKQDEMKENCWTSLMSQQGWVIELFDCKHALFSRKREDGPQRQFRDHQHCLPGCLGLHHCLYSNKPDGLLLNSWGWAQPEKLCRWGFPTEFGGRVPGYGIVALAVSEGETHSPSGLRKQNIEQRGCS